MSEFLNKKVVFVDQLQGLNPEKAVEYGKITDKDAAKRFGVRNIKEFSFWAWRACAIANIAMILKTENLFKGKLYDLVCEGLKIGGYAFRNKKGEKDIGWKHKSLCEILKKFGLKAFFKSLPIQGIIEAVKGGKYVIASIKSETGSHQVLIKGVILKDNKEGEFILNDPYTFGGKGGENLNISFSDFEKIYKERSIIAWRQREREEEVRI